MMEASKTQKSQVLSILDNPPPPPPPPPPLPPLQPLPPPFKTLTSEELSRTTSTSSRSYIPSSFIIAAIIAFAIVACASIHLILRFFARSSSSSPRLLPFIHRLSSSTPSSSTASLSSNQDQNALIDSLPVFSLASSVAILPKSSLDCAVCLSPFQPHDQLRLLPACRHAFHSPCIDAWLRSTPSCPLCRSSIDLPPPPPPPPPAEDASRSGSFRIEIGSISRRRMASDADTAGITNPPSSAPPHVRSFSLGSSFEYLVEEEVEAVLAQIRRPERSKEQKSEPTVTGPSPPGPEIAEAAGGSGRSWLKEYVDRLASSASSSFSSFRFSGQWSHRFDAGVGASGSGGGGESRDLEGNHHLVEEEDSALSTFYRWLVGAYS